MMRGLDFQKLEVSFSKGLNQKANAQLIQAPELVRAVDVEFDDHGGLRLRKPYSSIGTNIHGGGTISNCRRIYACGSELVLFTSTAMYSWSSVLSAWVLRGTHLAVKVDEETVFATTGDQAQCDRAELSNIVVSVWTDITTTGGTTGTVYYAIRDKATGAVLVAPTAVSGATGTPRVVATTTKILLFYTTVTPTLLVRSIDPTTLVLSAATTVLGANASTRFDVVRAEGLDAAVFASRRNPTTSYEVGTVTGALAVTQATKARTCDGNIAVSSAASGVFQVIRANGTNVQGDRLSAALADQATAQAIGTTTTNTSLFIAACHRADTRCYVFWIDDVSGDAADYNVKYNYVDTAGSIGTEAVFVRRAQLGSRAFTYNSSVYVSILFAGVATFAGSGTSPFDAVTGQTQSSHFIYRDDAFFCAKMAANRAGGLADRNAVNLPGVALTSGSTSFSFAVPERRVIPIGTVGSGLGYSDQGPRDITFTFDSNEARRVAKMGESLYIAAGEILQYDGNELTEVGFHYAPWRANVTENAAGNIAENAEWAFRFSYRWDNAKGERDRSTTAISGGADLASQPGSFDLATMYPLFITHKTSRPVAFEVWRTAVNPSFDSPFYLATNTDPGDTAGANCYVANDTTIATFATFNDDFTDDVLTTKENNPENDGVLENLAPPAASLIAANDTRLFLAGIPAAPDTIVYSKQRNTGEVAAFNDALTVAIPEPGGDLTGLAFLNETLVVFRETAIYALDGFGYDNTGGGSNYQARLVSTDCGAVSQESIALTPMGLVFKSSKGWYLLNRGWTTQYIGGPVSDYDSETPAAVTLVESQHQVRIVNASARVLVYDYLVDAWAEWSISNGIHACMWNGTYHYLASSNVLAEQSSYATADYGWDVEMLFHLGSLQGFSRVRRVGLLGEVRGTGTVRFRIGSYAEATYFDDKTWTISPTSAGAELNVQHMPAQQQHKALRVRLTSHATAGEKPKLAALMIEVGFKQHAFRHLPAAQKQ